MYFIAKKKKEFATKLCLFFVCLFVYVFVFVCLCVFHVHQSVTIYQS